MRRAVTLIETLAAVALLGLVGSVVAVGLGSAGEASRAADAVAMVCDLDQRARMVAEAGAGASLRWDRGGLLRVESGSVGRLVVFAERRAPPATGLTLQSPSGRELDVIRFDRRGRSPDYIATIRAGDHVAALAICGLTGWIGEAP